MGGDTLIDKAWQIYCDETKGGMHVMDFWHELSPEVQSLYLDKATTDTY